MADYKGTDQDDIIDGKALNLASWAPIYGLAGNDQISAGSANIIGGPGNDIITGLDAYAEAAYWGSPAAIEADLATGKVQDGWGGTDTLINIYSLQGTSFNDKVYGSDKSDRFHGNAGDDYFDGRGGNDTYAVYFEPSTNFNISYDAAQDAFILESKVPSQQNGGRKTLKNVEFVKFEGDGSDGVTIALGTLLPNGFAKVPGAKIDAQDAGNNPRWVIGDFNSDGLTDIAIRYDPEAAFSLTVTGSAPLRFFLGSSHGGFTETSSLLSPAVTPTLVNRIKMADLNLDGVPDILIGASGQDPYEDGKPAWDKYTGPKGEKSYVLLSKPGGDYALTDVPNMPLIFAHYLAVGDINNDGYVDAFISSLSADPSYILLSDKGSSFSINTSLLPKSVTEQTFTILTTFATGEPKTGYTNQYTAAAIFDVDGDGWGDLVLLPAGNSGTGKVVFNDGHGSFVGTRIESLPAGPYGSGVGERSSATSNTLYQTGTIYLDDVAVDVNGDGRLDLITISTGIKQSANEFTYYSGAALSILINTPNGFVDETAIRSDFKHEPNQNYTHYDTIEYRDFNADGFKDILVYRAPGNVDGQYATRILLNDGFGKFKAAPFPTGLSDGLIIVTDEVTSKYALPTSSVTGQRSANGYSKYVQSVDGVSFDWSKGLDLFTGKPDGRSITLSSDIPGRWVHGTAANNVITLSSGNEYAFGYQGNDSIDGGGGTDTAVYADRYADVSIKLSGKSVIVSTKTEGVDTLTNIEALRFADQTVMVSSLQRDLAASNFSLVTETGFAGSVGGSGRVVGTTGYQDITLSSRVGNVTFDPSFNAGGDVIHLPGKGEEWTIQRTGSSAKLVSDSTAVTIPIGTVGNWVVFSDGIRTLAYSDGQFKFGSQSFNDTASKITAPAETTSTIKPGTLPDAGARLILSEGAEVSVGGKVQVIGTSSGKETVEMLGGRLSFDASFNSGGDIIDLPGSSGAWTAVRSGSSMLLAKGTDTASVPIGTVGSEILIDNESRTLIYTSGQFKIGAQVIEGSSPATLLG